MGTYKDRKDKPNLGAVMTYIVSPTRALLVEDLSFPSAYKKLPGGGIEENDASIIEAAIRESWEETGIRLLPEEVMLLQKQHRREGVYSPFFCAASVSEQKLDTRLPIADENGKPMKTWVFNRNEIPEIPDLLERHRSFVYEVEGVE